ncbi:MAG TPA: outer membrane lipoprotein carrier protein LolA [Bacteroidetes bacterium]|nr:outer membrane lipoprotein carrier protein LolA [Bacteroidota bacterium]
MKVTTFKKSALALVLLQLIFTFFNHVLSTENSKAKEIIRKVQQKFTKAQTLEAEFTQTFHWTMVDEVQTFNGKLLIGPGDKFRIETQEQFIICDGKTVWTYDIPNNQVIIDDLQKTESTLLPKKLLVKYSKEFSAKLLGKETIGGFLCYHLQLLPHTEDNYIQKMDVWIDGKQWITRRLSYVDVNQNVTTYEIKNMILGKKLSNDLFQFQFPPQVEVIDMR